MGRVFFAKAGLMPGGRGPARDVHHGSVKCVHAIKSAGLPARETAMHARILIQKLQEIDGAINAGRAPETIRAMVREAKEEARRWQGEIAQAGAEQESLRRKARTRLFSRIVAR